METTKLSLKCPLCPRVREWISYLQMHCMVTHPDKFFTCPVCTMPFGSLEALRQHAGNCSKLEERPVKALDGEIDKFFRDSDDCRMCSGHFDSAEEMIDHFKHQHLHFTYNCEMCGKDFSQKSDLHIHSVACARASESILSTASSGNQDQNEVDASINCQGHDDCNTAGGYCAADESLDDSEFIDCCEEYCLECELDFGNLREFAEHFDLEHDIFICTICKIGFLEPNALKKHFALKHAGEKYATYYYGNELRKSYANRTEMITLREHISQISCPDFVDLSLDMDD